MSRRPRLSTLVLAGIWLVAFLLFWRLPAVEGPELNDRGRPAGTPATAPAEQGGDGPDTEGEGGATTTLPSSSSNPPDTQPDSTGTTAPSPAPTSGPGENTTPPPTSSETTVPDTTTSVLPEDPPTTAGSDDTAPQGGTGLGPGSTPSTLAD